MHFLGKHERSLDDKARLVLPAPWRRSFEDGGVLGYWDRCLALWTSERFGGVMEELIAKVRDAGDDEDGGKRAADLLRVFQGQSHPITLDTQGRFVVPDGHRQYAGIAREVTVLGAHDRVEVWASANFAELEQALTPEQTSASIRALRIF